MSAAPPIFMYFKPGQADVAHLRAVDAFDASSHAARLHSTLHRVGGDLIDAIDHLSLDGAKFHARRAADQMKLVIDDAAGFNYTGSGAPISVLVAIRDVRLYEEALIELATNAEDPSDVRDVAVEMWTHDPAQGIVRALEELAALGVRK